ncbi:hypothetical protein F511_41279 [Dorcoceras hygrometricum]|uniref:Uncharacterized protein n=1 Tax=Dorcoceras hygrometricum TaxID=472368 RepID=A0A2Z7BE30_9LAMI|nr:hypothetical protein F511_41279 [Dorcoceras hygrometricum]
MTIHRVFLGVTLLATRAWLRPVSRGNRHFTVGGGRLRQSGPRPETISLRSACTRRLKDFIANGFSSKSWPEQVRRAAACTDGGMRLEKKGAAAFFALGKSHSPKFSSSAQHIELSLRNHNSGLAHRIMYGPFNPYIPCKNQVGRGSVKYGPFNPYIPIRSTTIGKSRVAKDLIAMHTSWRSNSDITSVTSIGYPRMSASSESSTTMHRILHASGSHPIPPPNDPKTNQYNQDLGLIHSTNGNHLESPNEGSSIDHQVTIYLHAQNITMFPTNETWFFASHILVSISGGLILILTAQSTRN